MSISPHVYGEFCHALQNALAVLQSSLDALEGSLAPSSASLCQLMRKSIKDIGERIQDFLALSKVHHLSSIHKEYSLSAQLVDILEYVEVLTREHTIDIHSYISSDIMFLGNVTQIEELVVNILTNAIRHTQGVLTRNITVTLKKTVMGIVLLVHDSGTGIKKEDLPHVFERYYSTNPKDGHGLGLSIAKEIVEKHRGHISISSPPDCGTFVSIRFPLYET